MAFWLTIADALSFLGLAGTVLALACAIAAAIAFAIIGSPAHGGAATAGWLFSALLSLCSGFAGNWYLSAVALAALPVSLILAGALSLLRAALRT